jgi:hypothetical protein
MHLRANRLSFGAMRCPAMQFDAGHPSIRFPQQQDSLVRQWGEVV